MDLGINLQDYAANDILFGKSDVTQEQLHELSKALEAQQITGQSTLNLTTASGAPLKTESLEKTLKLITFREDEIVLWKKIPKLPAYNTVEEYNELSSYGSERGGFIIEGELPAEEDSVYTRRSGLVKFLGTTRSVTHPMTLVNTMIGDVVSREVKNGTLWLLRKLNRSLTKADSSMVTEEFNGIYALHKPSHLYGSLNAYYNSNPVVIDMRGATLTESAIEDAAEGIIENHGYGNELFAPPKVLSGFVKNFYGNKFINPNTTQVTAGEMGQKVVAFNSQFGRIGLNYDIFMNKDNTKLYNSGATHVNAPTVPTAVGATPVAATVTNTKWTSADAGDYYYGVIGVNRFGESAMVVLNTGGVASIVANGAVDLEFTPAGGVNPATSFVIYRSNKGPTSLASATFYPLFSVTTAHVTAGYDGAAAGLVRDNNRLLPNTNMCFLAQWDEECLAFKQLAPLMKMDLAVVSPAFRFMILLYGLVQLYTPKKIAVFVNVG